MPADDYEVLHKGALITKAAKALILLHGRGATAQSILSLSDFLCDDTFYIAAPQALNNSWYPYSFMEEEKRNEPSLSMSVQIVKNLIDEIAKHIPRSHLYIAGFSQGACLALEVSARHTARYGGVIALTGGLIGKTINRTKYQGNFEGTPIFMSNGDQDPHVPLCRSQQSKELLEQLGAQVTIKVYPGRPHIISDDEIVWARKFL